MISNDIYGTGLKRHERYSSLDGSKPEVKSSVNEFPMLKDINDAPKPKIKPILTEKGKYVVVGLILIGTIYIIWKNHQASQQQTPSTEQQPAQPIQTQTAEATSGEE